MATYEELGITSTQAISLLGFRLARSGQALGLSDFGLLTSDFGLILGHLRGDACLVASLTTSFIFLMSFSA
jgi:hypothetical protein